jgi:predicted RNA binding protein YcfA (HicA-like mRNA interferase family)
MGNKKQRVLIGNDVIKIFTQYGAVVKRTVGSHVRLEIPGDPVKHITIPLHNPIKRGTLHGIIKDFQECFGIEHTHKEFYH